MSLAALESPAVIEMRAARTRHLQLAKAARASMEAAEADGNFDEARECEEDRNRNLMAAQQIFARIQSVLRS